MEGNLVQAVGGGAFLLFIFGVCIWQLVDTSRAKKRRIVRELERTQQVKTGEWIDGGGI
jgi:hypothetical protein